MVQKGWRSSGGTDVNYKETSNLCRGGKKLQTKFIIFFNAHSFTLGCNGGRALAGGLPLSQSVGCSVKERGMVAILASQSN